MATATSTKRLRQDYLRIQRDPVPYVEATPLTSNILEWYKILFLASIYKCIKLSCVSNFVLGTMLSKDLKIHPIMVGWLMLVA